MFTGLIEALGTVQSIQQSAKTITLTLAAVLPVVIGDSVAVNGVCLTVTKYTKKNLTFNIMAPTWQDTTLALLKAGATVNLERALLPTSRLGGHFVAGHVDGPGTILAIINKKQVYEIEIATDKKWAAYIVAKGSIAIDGISLTIQVVKTKSFIVGVIPHTLQQTRLKDLQPGAKVNLEFDMLAKYIENILKNQKQAEPNRLRYFMR